MRRERRRGREPARQGGKQNKAGSKQRREKEREKRTTDDDARRFRPEGNAGGSMQRENKEEIKGKTNSMGLETTRWRKRGGRKKSKQRRNEQHTRGEKAAEASRMSSAHPEGTAGPTAWSQPRPGLSSQPWYPPAPRSLWARQLDRLHSLAFSDWPVS